MKKRVVCLLIGIMLVAIASFGCTSEQEKMATEKAATKQTAVDVVGAAQVEDELGIKILLPATINNETYSIIDGKIGLVTFAWDGLKYEYYIESAEGEVDATGIADTLGDKQTVLADNATYNMVVGTEGVGVTYWYDKNNKVACTLLISKKVSSDALKEVTESIISVQ